MKEARRRRSEFLVLASTAEAGRLSGRWTKVRELEGMPGGPHWLMRPEAEAVSAHRTQDAK
jgi:hypothetical protein